MNIHSIAIVRTTNAIPFALYDMLMKNGVLKETDWQKSEE